jgi:hypothetical protein
MIRERLASIRRPLILLAVAAAFLVAHAVLHRSVARGDAASVLLASAGTQGASSALLVVAFLVVRFISIVIVPGLLLAAAAEIVAYLLVGPKRTDADHGGGSTSISS